MHPQCTMTGSCQYDNIAPAKKPRDPAELAGYITGSLVIGLVALLVVALLAWGLVEVAQHLINAIR